MHKVTRRVYAPLLRCGPCCVLVKARETPPQLTGGDESVHSECQAVPPARTDAAEVSDAI